MRLMLIDGILPFLVFHLELGSCFAFIVSRNYVCRIGTSLSQTDTGTLLNYVNHNTETDDINHDGTETDIKATIRAINSIPLSLNRQQVMALPSNERYQYRIKQLLDYNQTYGSLDIPYNYEDDPQLGRWVHSQKYEYRLLKSEKIGVKSYLTPERMEILDAIGFPWHNVKGTKEEALTRRWLMKWELLKEYREEHGHVRITETCVYRGVKLGVWVKNQKRNARAKPDDFTTKVRTEKLKELGFDGVDTVYNATWTKRFEELKDFHHQHGHFDVPVDSDLFAWIKSQRILYRQDLQFQLGNCSNNRRFYLLDSIGFDWHGVNSLELKRNETWWARFEDLKIFKKKVGHLDVSKSMREVSRGLISENEYNLDIKRLHHWVKTQRVQYSRGKTCLTAERKEALSGLGFVFHQQDEQWEEKFEELHAFGQKYNHFNVPTIIPCDKVASEYYQGHSRDNLQFWDDLTDLGRWARRQRVLFRKYKRNETLSINIQNRMKRLDGIDFLTIEENSDNLISAVRGSSPEEKRRIWDKYFSELKEFKSLHGHCFIPLDHDSKDDLLYEWTCLQRRRFRLIIRNRNRGYISKVNLDRLNKLKDLGFVFNIHEFKFETSLNRLKEYRSQFGHVKVPPSYGEDPHLYPFVRRQRQLYREKKLKGMKNSLNEERIEKLDEIGFVWCPRGCSVE